MGRPPSEMTYTTPAKAVACLLDAADDGLSNISRYSGPGQFGSAAVKELNALSVELHSPQCGMELEAWSSDDH